MADSNEHTSILDAYIAPIDGRRNPDGNQNYELCRMYGMHDEIVRLYTSGLKFVTIAHHLQISPQTVSNLINDPLAQARISKLREARDAEAVEIGSRIMEIAPLAVDMVKKALLEGISKGDTDNKKLSAGIRASSLVLDHAHPKTVKTENIHGHVTWEQLQAIKKRRMEKMNADAAASDNKDANASTSEVGTDADAEVSTANEVVSDSNTAIMIVEEKEVQDGR